MNSATGDSLAVVLLGDVTHSRVAATVASRWLDTLQGALDGLCADDRLAAFEVTQGDEIQGLLAPAADPLRAVLVAALDPQAVAMRWAVRVGTVDPGTGPATRRTGEAFVRAREDIMTLRRRRLGLAIATGDPSSDALLDRLAPVLADLLARMSPSQRVIARLLMVEGLRQADAAATLRHAPATISVAVSRGGIRSAQRLAEAIRIVYAEGVERVAGAVRPPQASRSP